MSQGTTDDVGDLEQDVCSLILEDIAEGHTRLTEDESANEAMISTLVNQAGESKFRRPGADEAAAIEIVTRDY